MTAILSLPALLQHCRRWGGAIVKILFIINDAPYGSEKAYNALRMAMTLQKEHPDVRVRIFLMADAVTCGLSSQSTPQGYYNIERMLKSVFAKEGADLLTHRLGHCAWRRSLQSITLHC
jgi:uncharacterized protein involved in oxidation of intracellular sulfur